MQLIDRDLSDIIDNEALEYALYTVEERALPNIVDGFKPVQRFIIYGALQKSKKDKTKFYKLAGFAGGMAELGYHHGENSGADAGKLMANNWNNNVPFLDGQGSFGSRLVQKAGAARYVYCRISENFLNLYKDSELAPKHRDIERVPPAFYLPIIPTVLLNGVKGIATGYSTNILPHSLKSVIECTKLALEGKLDKEPEVEFPQFKGKIIPTETGVELQGLYELKGKTKLYINEIPYKWDRESYLAKIMDPLEDKGYIEYIDDSDKDGFKFQVTLRKDFGLITDDLEKQHEQIIKEFGLSQKVPQYFTVIGPNRELMDDIYQASDLIKRFVEIRKPYYAKRIENNISVFTEKYNLASAKADFIEEVLKGNLVITSRKKADVLKDIEKYPFGEYAEKLLSMNLYHITTEEAKKLKDLAKEAKKELSYWQKTTAEIEYKNDLDNL